MALYYQLSTQNVLTKFLSVSSITGGNSVNNEQLASTVASLLTTSVIPPILSTQQVLASSITTSSITAQSMSTLVLYASSIIGVTTGGGLATLPSTLSTFSVLTSSIFFSTAIGVTVSAQQLFVSSIVADTISSSAVTANTLIGTSLFASTATLSTFSTNTINFAGGFGYLTMPDIFPNTVYTSTVTASNLLVGINSVVSPIQYFGYGSYVNSVLAELSTGGTTQELVMFRGSNASDRIRFQTTGSLVFEPGVSARVWPTVPSNVTPAMVINTSSNVGILTASPTVPLDVAGTGRFQLVSTQNINLSTINGQVFGAPINSTTIGLGTLGYISSTQLTSTVRGLGQIYLSTAGGGGLASLPSTISSFSILTSSLIVSTSVAINSFSQSSVTSTLLITGSGLARLNGSASASLYGQGVDTFTLQTSCNAYASGIASLAFANSTPSYPLARIYAQDSAASGAAISQLIFQTVPISATSFTNNYTFTGADQTFTVPTGVTSIQVTMWGAGGSSANAAIAGGAGAFVQGLLSVVPGQVYSIVVGGGGSPSKPATIYGGGGSGSGGGRSSLVLNLNNIISGASGSGTSITYTTSSNHGLQSGQPVVISGLSPSGFNGTFAVSGIVSPTQFTVSSSQAGSSTGTGSIRAEVVIAGGGGGGGRATGVGGAATFSGTAFAGTGGTDFNPGQGGSQTAGGAGGTGTYGTPGASGSLLQGGASGGDNTFFGGGGGAGYYGGGGGGHRNASTDSGGGGGGSSYTTNTNFSLTLGLNSPNSQNQAPGTSVAGYISGVAVGNGNATGGSGLVILATVGNTFTEAMRINSNAFVGIGTTTPTVPLDVAGTGRVQNMRVGTVSTLNTVTYNGLFGNYNNTVLAEISTGGGTQELLMFKGSSASDRVRIQTTGNFVVETGVSARLFSTTTLNTLSNVTPAFIINTSSNVGIQTASPGATLDVAGTGRFQELSTQNINLSTINGQVFGAPINSTTIGLGTLGYVSSTQLVSTTSQLQKNIQGWSQYTTTTDITLGDTTAITVENPNNALQLKAPIVTIVDSQGGYGSLTLANQTFATSTSSEVYALGFSDFLTGTVSSFFVGRADGLTLQSASVYVSTIYLGNVGGTVVGQLTTDGTGTDLFWNGSKLNDQGGGGGGVSASQLTSTTVGLGTIGYISTAGGGGGGGAIDYVSAFTVSTGYLEVSTISTYSLFSYGIIASQLFNVGPEAMNITSLTDLSVNAASTILTGANSVYMSSSNDMRFVSPTTISIDTPELLTGNVFVSKGVSTYSLTVYGPSTLTVQGLSFFENVVSAPTLIVNNVGLIDSVKGNPVYIQSANGSIEFGGQVLLNQDTLTSTTIGLGSLEYVSTQSLVSTTVGITLDYGSALSTFSSAVRTSPSYIAQTVYLNESITVAPYKQLGAQTSTDPLQSTITTLPGNSDSNLLCAFQTDFNLPTFIPSGIWDLNLFAQATTSNAITTYYDILTRAPDTSEILLFTSENVPIGDVGILQYKNTAVAPYIDLYTGSTIVLKVYGSNSTGSPADITCYFESMYYSHLHTTLNSAVNNAYISSVLVQTSSLQTTYIQFNDTAVAGNQVDMYVSSAFLYVGGNVITSGKQLILQTINF
jgi:hypothetical protein